MIWLKYSTSKHRMFHWWFVCNVWFLFGIVWEPVPNVLGLFCVGYFLQQKLTFSERSGNKKYNKTSKEMAFVFNKKCQR